MVDDSEIIRLFQLLRDKIKMEEEAVKNTSPKYKQFMEGVLEGRKLTAYEICKYFDDIERPELSVPCQEILNVKISKEKEAFKR